MRRERSGLILQLFTCYLYELQGVSRGIVGLLRSNSTRVSVESANSEAVMGHAQKSALKGLAAGALAGLVAS